MRIYIGSDHAGFDLKDAVIKRYGEKFEFRDMGTFSNESVDYPDFAHKVADNVLNDSECRHFDLRNRQRHGHNRQQTCRHQSSPLLVT